MPREKILQIDQSDAILVPSAENFFREAEREMGAFVAAAEELYGVEAGRLAAECWIENLDKLDSANRERPTLRRVTVAAAARLAENTVEDSSNPPERRPFDDRSEPDTAAILRSMTDGVSHDIRNYLCAVFANVELMSFSATTQRAREELLEDIQSAIRSTIEMLDSLLLPSHVGQTHNFCLHSLNHVIAYVAKMVRTHPDAQRVHLTIAEHPILEASINRRKVGRAVYNLLLNACQAASRGSEPGKVRVTLREERSTIQIRVIDNGPGVPEAIRQALSKSLSGADERENVGLGLAIARCVAHEHGGFLELEESPMGRTVFILHLSKAKLRPIGRPCISTIPHESASRV